MFSCLDTSIVSTALISVSVEFQNYQDTPWTVLGYLLTYMSECDIRSLERKYYLKVDIC